MSEIQSRFRLGYTCYSVLVILALHQVAWAQGTLAYDQQSATSGFGPGGSPIQLLNPAGQSFTPAAGFVGFVQFQFLDHIPNNLAGSTVFINLRQDSMTGPVLAATPTVFMRDGFFGITSFYFARNVAVSPGREYFFEAVLQSGDDSDILSGAYGYAAGTAYFLGQPTPSGNDLWFREGYIVPEPSTLCFGLLGTALLVWSYKRRRHS